MCRRLTINFCRLQNYIHFLNEMCPLISSMSIIIMTLRIVVPLAEIEGRISAQCKAHTHARTHARRRPRATEIETQKNISMLMAGSFDPIMGRFMNVWTYVYQECVRSRMQIVTVDPGSKPDQKFARRRDRQKYISRTK